MALLPGRGEAGRVRAVAVGRGALWAQDGTRRGQTGRVARFLGAMVVGVGGAQGL